MGAMLVRDAPQRVHDWLKRTADESRRSLNQQIIVCLEWCMERMPRETPSFPQPVRLGGGKVTLSDIDKARKLGRK